MTRRSATGCATGEGRRPQTSEQLIPIGPQSASQAYFRRSSSGRGWRGRWRWPTVSRPCFGFRRGGSTGASCEGGGYTDITTRGAPERILPIQFALDGEEFLRRFAERELLYFHREDVREPLTEELVILLDQGVRTWGDVRLLLSGAVGGTRPAGGAAADRGQAGGDEQRRRAGRSRRDRAGGALDA